MSVKIVKNDSDALIAMAKGVNTLAQAVAITLGPKGRNVVLEKPYGPPVITKDGVSVAREIELEDKFENIGAQLVKQVASRTAEVAGDGTTTATVLAQSILSEGLKCISAGMNPMDVKRGIDSAVDAIVENLFEQSRDVTSNTEIAQVGSISANSDMQIGELIAAAMARVGNNGIITLEEGSSLTDELVVVEGMQFDRGYLSPFFVTDQTKQLASLSDPYILLTDQKISNVKEMIPVLEAVAKQKKPLVIIADEVDGEALATLVVNNMKGLLPSVAVRAPLFGDRKKAMLEDLAVLTGGTVVSLDTGMTLNDITLDHLGRAKRVDVTKDSTTVVDGGGDAEKIADRVNTLREQVEAAEGYDKEKLKERLGKLTSGVAIIKIGASTEVEMKEKKDRVEDALFATRAAVEEGILPGGGIALIRASKVLENVQGSNVDQTAGINIVKKAVEAPLRQIVINAGHEPAVVINTVLSSNDKLGYNAATGTYGDMIDMGVLDPTKVTRSALQNAASVAGLMLTTHCVVAIKPVEDVGLQHLHQPPAY